MSPRPFVNRLTCIECRGLGVAIFNGTDIQRCDTCRRFSTDEDAANAVDALLVFVAKHSRGPNMKRRLADLERKMSR